MKEVQKLCVVRQAPEMSLQYSVYTRLQDNAIIDCYCAHLQSHRCVLVLITRVLSSSW